MNSYIKAYKQYFDFSTRTSRKDFWLFMLFVFIVNALATFLDSIFFGASADGVAPLSTIAAIVQFIPSIAVSARRLHDIDRSGWWQLIVLVPIVGFIVLIVFYCKASQEGANRFGPNPYGDNQYNPVNTPPSSGQFSQTIPLDELEKLNKLKLSGAISDDEFAVMKSKLLSSNQ